MVYHLVSLCKVVFLSGDTNSCSSIKLCVRYFQIETRYNDLYTCSNLDWPFNVGIYLLNMFLAFLTPKFDPSLEQEEEDEEGPTLPTRNDEEFRPFIRRLPEFKFWYASTKATAIALVCSFVPALDIPVFWPILLIYFCLLFALTMRRQIQHMIRYKYVPFDFGKRKYKKVVDMDALNGGGESSSPSGTAA